MHELKYLFLLEFGSFLMSRKDMKVFPKAGVANAHKNCPGMNVLTFFGKNDPKY